MCGNTTVLLSVAHFLIEKVKFFKMCCSMVNSLLYSLFGKIFQQLLISVSFYRTIKRYNFCKHVVSSHSSLYFLSGNAFYCCNFNIRIWNTHIVDVESSTCNYAWTTIFLQLRYPPRSAIFSKRMWTLS